MPLFKRLTSVLGLVFVFTYSLAQKDVNSINPALKTMDTLRSKALTSFLTDHLPQVLQTAISNGIISGSASAVKVNTTIFGLEKLFNPKVAIDSNYIHQTFQRNFSFGGAMDIANGSTINGGQGNMQWAFINHRDISRIDTAYLRGKLRDIKRRMDVADSLLVIDVDNKLIQPLIKAHRTKDANGNPLITEDVYKKLVAMLAGFGKNNTDSNLNVIRQAFKPYPEILIDTSVFQEYHLQQTVLIDSLSSSLTAGIKKGSLWTFSVNSNFQAKNTDSVILKLEFIHGIGSLQDTAKPWDLYAGVFYNFKTDTVSKQILHRDIASFKFGVNKVFAVRQDGSPFFEVLGTAEVDDVTYGRYDKEQQYTILPDFTFTIKATKAISIPLEIKYDPKQKNFLGFLDLKWDILTSSK